MSSLVTAVEADLQRWGIDKDSALAASAVDLATRLAEADIRPSAAAALHAQLRATLAELGKVAKPEEAADPVDELNARRQGRRERA